MAKNRTFTGGKQSIGTPTLSKNSYYQLIRKIRKEKENAAQRQLDGKSDDMTSTERTV